MENELIQQVANLGFPIIVSMYLLVRIEGKMEKLTDSIQLLAKHLDKSGKE